MAKQQDLTLLYRAMRELPEDKRELIVLSRFQGLTYEQIGSIVGCETGTVKVRVFRAMKEMGRIFNGFAKGESIMMCGHAKERMAASWTGELDPVSAESKLRTASRDVRGVRARK